MIEEVDREIRELLGQISKTVNISGHDYCGVCRNLLWVCEAGKSGCLGQKARHILDTIGKDKA